MLKYKLIFVSWDVSYSFSLRHSYFQTTVKYGLVTSAANSFVYIHCALSLFNESFEKCNMLTNALYSTYVHNFDLAYFTDIWEVAENDVKRL